MSEDPGEYDWERRHAALRRVQISVCYHRKRERFFDFLDRLAKGIAIFGGSVAFVELVRIPGAAGDGLVAQWCAAGIAVTSTLALVFGFGERARRHSELAREFLQLEAQILAKGNARFEARDVDGWEARIRTLEMAEPPALNALVVVCQNEIALAAKKPIFLLPWHQRAFAHFWSFTIQEKKSSDSAEPTS